VLARRRFLRLLGQGSLVLVVAAGAGPLLGRALGHRWRRRRPDDLPAIPWIGHC